jgi:hypothetical protein
LLRRTLAQSGGLDFVFLISAAAGLIAAQWLALIPEPGKTGKILWEFKEELSLPFRRSRSTAAFGENDLWIPDLSVPKTPCMLKSLHLQSHESSFRYNFVRAHK